MPLTKTAKEELYKILLGNSNLDIQSEILPNPSFKNSGQTSYVQDFITDSNGSVSSATIKKIISFEDKEIVLFDYFESGNATKMSAFGIFNDRSGLIYSITKQTNDTTPFDLPYIYDFKITKDGIIFGFSDGIEQKVLANVHFFIFNDILSLIGTLPIAELEQESFFSAIVDVQTEIKDPKTGDVTGGNRNFELIKDPLNRYGFNQDEIEPDVFGFVVWNNSSKKVTVIRFETDSVNIDPAQVDYRINEELILTQGTDLDGSDFDGISLIDILTGDRKKISNETSYGSIIFSTQKDKAANQQVPFDQNVNGGPPVSDSSQVFYGYTFGAVTGSANANDRELETTKKVSSTDLLLLAEKFIPFINSNPNQIDYSIDVNLSSKYNGQSGFNLFLNTAQVDQILNDKDIALYETIKMNSQKNSAINGELTFEVTWYFAKTGGIANALWGITKTTKVIDIQGQRLNSPNYDIGIYNVNAFFIDVNNRLISYGQLYINQSYDLQFVLNVNGTRIQQVVSANTTSQILIESENSKDVYKIIQSENNSYEGTDPVFITSLKAFIPLKKKSNNEYSIFEFNGDQKQSQVDTERIFNDISVNDYTDSAGDSYKAELLEPSSIVYVKLNNTSPNLPTSRYTLNGKILTITGIKNNDILEIKYKTKVGTPKELVIKDKSSGNDVFISSVLDQRELGSVSRAIIGFGDDSINNSVPTNVFGFNLFKDKSSIEYNRIAEHAEPLTIKIRHVIGSRENDILFIKAFNQDYSQFVEFVQIYPDSFAPYTYQPYNNYRSYFAISRLSINKDGLRERTSFDRQFLDTPNSSNVINATTTAKATDANEIDNNQQIIYGATNEPLFEIDKTLIKEPTEILKLNYSITTEIIDRLDKDEIKQEASDRLTQMFVTPNSDEYKGLAIDKFVLTYENNTQIETPAAPYLKYDSVAELIRVEISLYNKDIGQPLDKLPKTLELFNVAGELLTNIDLTKDPCIEGFTNIGFDIVITDKKYPFLRYGVNRYGEVPWAPAKGRKR